MWRKGIFALLTLLLMGTGAAQAKEFYKEGRFTVRYVQEACKLEVGITPSDREGAKGEGGAEAVAMLSLFPSDKYYAEFFTERKRLGLAKGKLKLTFDEQEPMNLEFLDGEDGKDDHWRWQYLKESEGLLELVRRSRQVKVEFSNGKDPFRYVVNLSGSSKAITALQGCAKNDGKKN